MIFSRPLIIESTLTVGAARARLRAFATSRSLPDLEAYRRRQILGWRLSERGEEFLFQPEYGDVLNVEGARFLGLAEPAGAGSRVRGRITLSLMTRIVVGVWMLAVAAATIVTLGQGAEAPAKVMEISALMFAVTVLMVRYSLWSTARIVEVRLRQALDGAGARVAA
jgi:hypothetical protein